MMGGRTEAWEQEQLRAHIVDPDVEGREKYLEKVRASKTSKPAPK